MARIVTVYNPWLRAFRPTDMSYIRWLKISEALARCGHQVDIATNEPAWWMRRSPIEMEKNLRRVSLSKVKWNAYDVVMTLFQIGFNTLETYGGSSHPFIISEIGSVVASKDMEGIYFYGDVRNKLYSTQEKVNRASRYVAVLSHPAKDLWHKCFDQKNSMLIVPGGVDAEIPPPGRDPYPERKGRRCLFAGNVYTRSSQPEANRVLMTKLNELGKLLAARGARLYMLGTGDVSRLDKNYVTYLGATSYQKSWDYFHFADVGIVVSAGVHHNNESSKIYHYLRVGLPVVTEASFPNDNVVTESKLGFIVENNNLELMAARIAETEKKDWNRDYAITYTLNHHTWDKRVEVYDTVLKSHFA